MPKQEETEEVEGVTFLEEFSALPTGRIQFNI